MSRPSKPKPAPLVAAPAISDPAAAAPPQVTPEPTGAEAGVAASVTAPVEPIPEAGALDLENVTGPDGVAVSVTGPAKGRWRIGRHFGPTPVVIPLNELTEAQMKALQADPDLNCVVVDLVD